MATCSREYRTTCLSSAWVWWDWAWRAMKLSRLATIFSPIRKVSSLYRLSAMAASMKHFQRVKRQRKKARSQQHCLCLYISGLRIYSRKIARHRQRRQPPRLIRQRLRPRRSHRTSVKRFSSLKIANGISHRITDISRRPVLCVVCNCVYHYYFVFLDVKSNWRRQ